MWHVIYPIVADNYPFERVMKKINPDMAVNCLCCFTRFLRILTHTRLLILNHFTRLQMVIVHSFILHGFLGYFIWFCGFAYVVVIILSCKKPCLARYSKSAGLKGWSHENLIRFYWYRWIDKDFYALFS
jgi:hypothetical protein